ncbi:kinase-like domain-containing protein [Fomitopsis serialis]|uniref:kinase-like domain-containing protein n=1 Tax=Fomitopsis serialis TaxID=139415 RepID=UPI002007FB6A|nr:kinase-like domain-containing protein [Neoantrodia serialis]KAH9927737.1 kinase-like domain-containing protein [Neoantrodia serialis]
MSISPPDNAYPDGSARKPSKLPYYVYLTEEAAQIFEKSTREGSYALSPDERWWSARESCLFSAGYSLRPRYHANWSPSWLGTRLNPLFCEDSIMSERYHIMDAVRKRDGAVVTIKMVKKDTREVAIAQYLSSATLAKDPHNHCVSVFDVLPDPFEPKKMLMIMQYLRPFDDPPFMALGEVIDFISQTLEGISFLHRHRVAHRDCAGANIMMDGRPLYPEGHHPVSRDLSTDAIYDIVPRSRLDHPVRYYYIDFGISSFFPDKEVPELSDRAPYNAFKVDIFILGNLYRKHFVQKYNDFKMLESLIDGMTRKIPEERLTADEAVVFFQGIRSTVDPVQWRARLRPRGESTPEWMLNNAVHMAREGVYRMKKLVA